MYRRLAESIPNDIIVGHTIGGLSQRTKERDPDYADKYHVDWWIYQDCIEDIIADFIIMDDKKTYNYFMMDFSDIDEVELPCEDQYLDEMEFLADYIDYLKSYIISYDIQYDSDYRERI